MSDMPQTIKSPRPLHSVLAEGPFVGKVVSPTVITSGPDGQTYVASLVQNVETGEWSAGTFEYDPKVLGKVENGDKFRFLDALDGDHFADIEKLDKEEK